MSSFSSANKYKIAFFKENLRLNYNEPLNRGLTIRVDIMFHCFVWVDPSDHKHFKN